MIEEGIYSTAYGILLYYIFGLIPYNGCRNQVFGTDGKHTDLICGAHEISTDVCRREPEVCDFVEYKAVPLYSIKGTAFLNTENTARVLCASVTNYAYTPQSCPEATVAQLTPTAQQLQGLISMMPDGANNPLLTLGGIEPTLHLNGVDRIMAIGESWVDIREELYDEKLFPLAVKYTMISMFASFIRDKYSNLNDLQNPFVFDGEQEFFIYSLQGYLFQKYGSEWFTDEELAEGFPMLFAFEGGFCDVDLGAYYAWNCTSLADFLEIQDQIASEIDFINADKNSICDLLQKNGKYTDMMKTGLNTMKYNIGSRCTNGCEDSTTQFEVSGKGLRTCDWAVRVNKPSKNGVPGRCSAHPEVAENCPDTCGTCCKDTAGMFYVSDVPTMKKGKKRSCEWAGRKKTAWRCKMDSVKENCPQVCGVCAK